VGWQECVEGEWGESGLGSQGSILLIIYHRSSLTGVIHSGRGRLHTRIKKIGAGLGDVILKVSCISTTRSSDLCHIGTRMYVS